MTTFWSAIVNGAILSALLSLGVWLVFQMMPRRALNAATRYAIWWVVLVMALALPLSYTHWNARTRVPVRQAARLDRGLQWQPVNAVKATSAISLPIAIPANRWLRPVLILWSATSLLLLLRVLLSYLALYRRSTRAVAAPAWFDGRVERWLARSGSGRERIRLAISSEIEIPVATGPVSAAVLIPSTLLDALSDADLDQIGLHEAGHLARYDDYALLAQRVIEALFALHPVVRWVTRQIDLEREIACDDIVAGSAEHARSYADCLTRAVALCGGVRTSLAAANVADSRSHLSRRVELLLSGGRTGDAVLRKSRWAAIAVALIGTAGLLTKTPLMVAFAAPQAAPTSRPPAAVAPPVPNDPTSAWVQQGDLQVEAREFEAAIETYLRALPEISDPRRQGAVWSRIGEAYRRENDFVSSIGAMQHAEKLLPDDAKVAANLALLYEATKDLAHARQYYEKALAIDHNNPLALNNLAYILPETGGDLDLALTDARAAQQQLPTFLEVNDTIGWIYLKKNWVDDAIGSFRLLTEQAPQIPEYHYHLALALYQQGSLAEAMDECKSALLNKPGPDMDKDIHELIDKIAPISDIGTFDRAK